jgi:hypothetical protein
VTMFHTGKCPGCKKNVSTLMMERVEISEGIGGPKWHGVNLLCPSCKTVLGATLDSVALQADLANAIGRKVRQVMS